LGWREGFHIVVSVVAAAHPYPIQDACASHCNTPNTRSGSAADAVRRKSGHDPNSRAVVSRSDVQRTGSATRAIRTEPGNLRLRKTAWWGWKDSNFQPNGYQPPALSIEPTCGFRARMSLQITDFDEPGLAPLSLPAVGNGDGVVTDAIRMCG
jgi:hypothetical protein